MERSRHRDSPMTDTSGSAQRNRAKLFLLYLLMGAGGLWHVLGVLQALMESMAGPMLIGLTTWLVFECWRGVGNDAVGLRGRTYFLLWSGLMVVVTHLVETFGQASGLIFGDYSYGHILLPELASVPLAIGFAWLSTLLCSAALFQRLAPARWRTRPVIAIVGTAMLMTMFDVIMEPAAIKLGYWRWEGASVPMQNYVAWFVMGLLLAAASLGIKRLQSPLPPLLHHAYPAQVLYFTMVIVS